MRRFGARGLEWSSGGMSLGCIRGRRDSSSSAVCTSSHSQLEERALARRCTRKTRSAAGPSRLANFTGAFRIGFPSTGNTYRVRTRNPLTVAGAHLASSPLVEFWKGPRISE